MYAWRFSDRGRLFFFVFRGLLVAALCVYNHIHSSMWPPRELYILVVMFENFGGFLDGARLRRMLQ